MRSLTTLLRRSRLPLASSSALALAACLLACGSDPAPPPDTAGTYEPPSGAARKPRRSTGADTASDTTGSINISEDILKKCGSIPTARFAFDSADIAGEAASTLDALATCFISGPLAGRAMKLVGHADPRGQEEYNLALGQRRAGSVAEYLQKRGMSSSKVSATSRGELEASGTDDAGWARDRKVDVLLAD